MSLIDSSYHWKIELSGKVTWWEKLLQPQKYIFCEKGS